MAAQVRQQGGRHTFRPRDEVRSWSESLPEEFLLCRDLGHLWRPYKARYMAELNAYARVLRCGRCKTERNQYVSTSGGILSGGYDYPEGYQAPPGAGRLNGEGRDELRLTSVLRLLGADEGP